MAMLNNQMVYWNPGAVCGTSLFLRLSEAKEQLLLGGRGAGGDFFGRVFGSSWLDPDRWHMKRVDVYDVYPLVI